MSADTTWTVANSPYVLVDTVTVAVEATLTIEPGVEVTFQGGGIEVLGALVANGASEAPVSFTSALADPADAPLVLFDRAVACRVSSPTRAACPRKQTGPLSRLPARALRIRVS